MSRGPRWTEIEHRKLRYMRDIEKRPWAQISLPGRSRHACEEEYHKRRFGNLAPRKPKKTAQRPARLGRPPLSPELPAPAIERAIPKPSRNNLTSLRERFELRDRI